MSASQTGSGRISSSKYARERRELITLMDRMRGAGVGTEIDLPRVAIAGNQSAGKSSLVEAISGIKVPRDAGTCTRCPFEVRLRHSEEPWICKVSLRFETREDGKALARVREVPFGDTLRNPDQVENVLRRAQLAILNQSVSPHAFLTATNEDVKLAKEGHLILGSTKQVSFSTNLVCIDIAGPDLTDLAFIDLPGIISNVDEGEDEDNIDLIKNLVRKTITGNALILLIFSMRDDLENQSAGRLAREADPEGKRTIGVLTKADTLHEGEHGRWFQILEGQRAKLSNGYFATKLPGAADLGKNLTFEAAREAEKNFFNNTAPWSTLGPDVKNRLGTPKLTSYLSEKLSAYIRTKLPEIRQTVADSLNTTQNHINSLPPPPSADPLGELLGLLQGFRSDLEAYVAGRPGFEALIKGKNRIQDRFAANIRATRPRLLVICSADSNWDKKRIQISDMNPKQKVYDCLESTKLVDLCLTERDRSKFFLQMTLDDVTNRISQLKTRETPLNIPFSAKSSLMIESTKGWGLLTENALAALREPVQTVVLGLVDKYFGRYTSTGLAADVKDICSEVTEKLFLEAEERIRHLVALERTPFTLNTHYYEATYEKVRATLTQQRKMLEAPAPPPETKPQPPEQAQQAAFAANGSNGFASTFERLTKEVEKKRIEDEQVRDALAALAKLGYNVKKDDLPKLLPMEDYSDELDVLAHVQANWKVAYKRIIDNVPRFVDYDILQKLPLAISTAFARLASGGAEGAASYVREDTQTHDLRVELNTRLAKIQSAKHLLSSFGRS